MFFARYCCHALVKTCKLCWQAQRRTGLSTASLSATEVKDLALEGSSVSSVPPISSGFLGAPYIQKIAKSDWTCLEVRGTGHSMEAHDTTQSTEVSSSRSERTRVQCSDCHAMPNNIRYQHSAFRLVGSDHEKCRARDGSWQAELTG